MQQDDQRLVRRAHPPGVHATRSEPEIELLDRGRHPILLSHDNYPSRMLRRSMDGLFTGAPRCLAIGGLPIG
ncbi:MAG: hypothetical protein ACREV8_11165, partial [Gammaproteobacteria bacterium]